MGPGNVVDGELVSEIVRSLLPRETGGELRFHFPSGAIEPVREYPGPLHKSMVHYAARFSRYLHDEGVDHSEVRDATIVVSIAPRGIRCFAEANDDRGRRYHADIIPD
jgi:hypothetical protein